MNTRPPKTCSREQGRIAIMHTMTRRNLIAAAAGSAAVAVANAGIALAEESSALNPGTYTVTVDSIKGVMTVAVSFSESAITDVHVLECNDSEVIKDVAIASVSARIVEQQNIEVDGATGATFTSLALKNAVSQAIELAGGDVAAFEKGSDAVAEKAQGETEEFDLVVIGAGAAGLSAAITAAREEVAPSVLLLEKQAFVGGCYRVCGGGMWAMGAPINEWVGQDCTTEELVKFMQGRSGDNEIDVELWGNIHDISSDVFMYMIEQGVAVNPLTWVAIGATRVSPPESMRAGVKPVQPASYRPMRGPGKDDIHEAASAYGETPGKVPVAVSPVSTTIAQTVAVLAWLSMPKTAEYSDMGASRPWGVGRRASRRLWWETFWTACRDLSRAGGRETPTRLSSRHIV